MTQTAPVDATLHLNVVSCYLSIYVLYIFIIKKVQPKTSVMQHHIQCSSEVFRHWWVTIIKTPKVSGKWLRPPFFDSYSVPPQIGNNESCCRLCTQPLLPLPQSNQRALRRAEKSRGGTGGQKGLWEILCSIFRKTVANSWIIQLPLAW